MPQEDLAKFITQAVADGFQEQIEYTQKLIRFGGQRGHEHSIQDFVFTQYASRGYSPIKLEMDETLLSQHEGAGKFSPQHSTAPVVVGVHHPHSPKGRSLILNAHIDIVPTGPGDLWTHPPYSGVIEGDWLYGRGGADMRAGHAANLYALDALRKIGLQPAAEVILESVVEEESTGNGTVLTHLKGYRADAVIIPEPEEEKLVRANTGVLWFQVLVRGTPVHVREMGAGANAIDGIYRVVGALRELETRWNEQKKGKLHFEKEEHPINLNVAKIEGGDWASSVPAWCRIDCRIAIFPSVNAKAAAREIEECISDFSAKDSFLSKTPPKVTWNGFFAEGYELEPGSDAEKVLERAHMAATGKELQSFMTAGYLDTRVHVLYDKIPALCYGPISENIHGFDERVSVKSLQRITTAIALFIAEWCGVEEIR
jgi:acetylornithine deacetylase